MGEGETKETIVSTKKSLDTLVTDIYALFQNPPKHLDEVALDEFLGTIRSSIIDAFTEKDKTFYLRPSNYGKPCARSLWYGKHSTKPHEPLSSPTLIKFLYGHILEALVIFLSKQAGHEVTHLQKRVEHKGLKGSLDCYIDGVLVDVKSASSFSFEKFAKGELAERDSFGYLPQIAFYAKAEGVKDTAFVAIDKTLGKICVYKPEKLPSVDDRIDYLKEALLDGDEPPPKAFTDIPDGKSGNRKLGVECSYCGYKTTCWPKVRTFLYASGPRFLNYVAKTPNVMEALNNDG